MPEILIEKLPDGRIACETDYDKSLWDKIPAGAVIAIRPRRPRHPKFHRWSRVLISFLADNWPGGKINDEQASRWLKMKTGLVHILKDPETGEMIVIPDSTAWDSMADPDYRHWIYQEAIPAVAIKLGMTIEDLQAAMNPVKAWGKCENPECGNGIGTDAHHIFGGTFARPKSEALGLMVKLCRRCHDLAEEGGTVKKYKGIPKHLVWEGTNIEYWRRVYCKVRGWEYEAAYLKIFGSGQAEENPKTYKLKGGDHVRKTQEMGAREIRRQGREGAGGEPAGSDLDHGGAEEAGAGDPGAPGEEESP